MRSSARWCAIFAAVSEVGSFLMPIRSFRSLMRILLALSVDSAPGPWRGFLYRGLRKASLDNLLTTKDASEFRQSVFGDLSDHGLGHLEQVRSLTLSVSTEVDESDNLALPLR